MKVTYLVEIQEIMKKIEKEQTENIKKAAEIMADAIYNGKIVYLFGSAHSMIPALDCFPRWGSYVGFEPIVDLRLMWNGALGQFGAPQVLFLERQEGYAKEILKSYKMGEGDCIIVFSHGGVNAAPVEMALNCKNKGLKVIAVTSLDNYKVAKSYHSTGKKLGDIADIVIDNGAPKGDALIEVEGVNGRVGGVSTATAIIITMSLQVETAKILTKKGMKLNVFISPTVKGGLGLEHNDGVYKEYETKIYRKS